MKKRIYLDVAARPWPRPLFKTSGGYVLKKDYRDYIQLIRELFAVWAHNHNWNIIGREREPNVLALITTWRPNNARGTWGDGDNIVKPLLDAGQDILWENDVQVDHTIRRIRGESGIEILLYTEKEKREMEVRIYDESKTA